MANDTAPRDVFDAKIGGFAFQFHPDTGKIYVAHPDNAGACYLIGIATKRTSQEQAKNIIRTFLTGVSLGMNGFPPAPNSQIKKRILDA